MTTKHNQGQVAKAAAIVEQIPRKVGLLLEPLEREIRIMGWKPVYAAIVWEAVAREAMQHAVKAEADK
jgi:hypothetical protein